MKLFSKVITVFHLGKATFAMQNFALQIILAIIIIIVINNMLFLENKKKIKRGVVKLLRLDRK